MSKTQTILNPERGTKSADFVPAAPKGALAVDEGDQDALLGAQLTAQWEVVKSGQKQQLLFGAMMLRLRDRLSARGQAKEIVKGDGFKGWLESHAPTIGRQSAYRMMEVAEGIRDDLKIGKSVDLEELLSTAFEDLPEKLAKKREQIEEVIEGKSQRQLLLEFGRADAKPAGGNTYERGNGKGARKRLTHEEAMELLRKVNVNAMEHLRFLHDKRAYVALKDEAELDGLLNHLEETTKVVRAWKKMSRTERAAALAEQVKLQIEDAAKE